MPLYGTENGNSRLSERDVIQIKKLRKEGWTNQQLAEKFYVSTTAISNIFTGRTWKGVGHWLDEGRS